MSSFELRMTPSRGLPSPSSPPPSVALFVFIVKGKEAQRAQERVDCRGKDPFPLPRGHHCHCFWWICPEVFLEIEAVFY